MVTNNQINTSKPVGVSDGGTGVASFTAYSLIAGGTTSTGALQSAGTGTSGKWYVSNGSASLGTFKTISVVNQVITATGTYTPTSGMVYCQIQCLGAGGAGGGSPSTSGIQVSAGSGGGSGEYAAGVFTASQVGASKSVTIGAGGVAVSGATGGNGGNTSVGALITANGGSGGITIPATGVASASAGGAGGTGGSGGEMRTPGSWGFGALCCYPAGFSEAGQGGNSQFGAGGPGGAIAGAGTAALGYGAGGGGSQQSSSGGNISGGSGKAGVVYITEYVIS